MGSETVNYNQLFSHMAKGLTRDVIRKLVTRTDIISFAASAPSAEMFPRAQLARIASQVIREGGQTALQYGPTRGNRLLLELLQEETRRRGILVSGVSQIVITTGSQQGLDLAARILLDPGDVAIVELPSYVGGTIALRNSRAELWGVAQDDGGIIVDAARELLERARAQGRRVKCLYTIPNFQNPSGVSLADERRPAIAELADRYDFIIVEDDPYGELCFADRHSLGRSLAAIARHRVVYLSSFSKILAPALRIGWLCAPDEIASKVELAKEGADLSSSQLDMAIVAESLRSGLIHRRLPMIREFYRVRCEVILEALARHFPSPFRWTKPLGGFFIMMTAPRETDAAELLPQALEAGVAYTPGNPFFVDGSGTNTMRLAFSKETPERIKEGIARLSGVLS